MRGSIAVKCCDNLFDLLRDWRRLRIDGEGEVIVGPSSFASCHGWILNFGTGRKSQVALSDIDRRLLQRCLAGEPRSWEEFVDRFMGLVLHVVDHTLQARGISALTTQDREDIVSEVFLAVVRNDRSLLRHFRGESSLATYLTVVARRITIHQLSQRNQTATLEQIREAAAHDVNTDRISDQEQLERLLAHLHGHEAQVVRMYHLEGKSYREISDQVGMPENSIGPTLSRARSKLRQVSANSTLS